MDVPNCAAALGLASWEGALRKQTTERQFSKKWFESCFRKCFPGGTVFMAARESKTLTRLFIGRWTPRILFSLNQRPHRHGELRRYLGTISQRMLTRTLRNLESKGLIGRRVTTSKAIAVEYSLTQLGASILAPLREMCRWAKTYGRAVSADLYLLDAHQKG